MSRAIYKPYSGEAVTSGLPSDSHLRFMSFSDYARSTLRRMSTSFLPSNLRLMTTIQYSIEGKIKELNLIAEAEEGLLSAVLSYASGKAILP
ncbi:hypothetical protein BDZ89DRAFT_1147687 [Hymenopellis radicata]|nr:hypothetical protein BDZ89DRAFT_1147687 [Hymenopellis radicata]